MKTRHYLLTGIIAYIVFLIATLPAAPVLGLLDGNNSIQIDSVRGTVWHGSARTVTIDRRYTLTSTRWSLDAWSLLSASLAADIDTRFEGNNVTTRIGSTLLGRLYLDDTKASISAEQLSRLANIPIAHLSGQIGLDLQHAYWSRDELPHAYGTVTWQQASVTVADSADLGDVRITLDDSEDGQLQALIKNQGGDIKLDGSADLIPEKDYRVAIKLTPTATANDNIKQSLGIFARKQNNGSYLFTNQGSLNQLGLR